MQLTGPIFLFLFLPLALPLTLFFGRRHRAAALAVFSIAWFLLANRGAAWGLFAAVPPLLLALFAPRLARRGARVALGAVLPLCWCLAVRLAAEYTALGAYYPTGLTLLSLHAAFLALSPVRPRGVWGTLSYLFFFPVLTAGPALDPAAWDEALANAAFDLPRFSAGIVRFARGFSLRVAVCATLFRILAEWQTAGAGISLVILLPVSFFALFTFFAGTREMAAGFAAMCGMELPAAPAADLTEERPRPLFFGYEADRLFPRANGFFAVLPYLAAAVLVRPRPIVLAAALPFFALARLPVRKPAARVLRMGLLGLAAAVFSLAVVLPSPAALAALFSVTTTPRAFLAAVLTRATSRYLYLGVALLVLLPLWRLADRAVLRRAAARGVFLWQILKTTAVFAIFVFTILFFLPQYPSLSDGLPLIL